MKIESKFSAFEKPTTVTPWAAVTGRGLLKALFLFERWIKWQR